MDERMISSSHAGDEKDVDAHTLGGDTWSMEGGWMGWVGLGGPDTCVLVLVYPIETIGHFIRHRMATSL